MVVNYYNGQQETKLEASGTEVIVTPTQKAETILYHSVVSIQHTIHAELYAQLIPNAKLTFFKQEGHLSLLVNNGEEILQSITI